MPAVPDGVGVLDLSTIVAGPAASMILADLGALVIQVERPGAGEDGRAMGPNRGPWGAYFTTLNRGKRSIALDIRQPAGREAGLRIAATCDVFLENSRGGKAAASWRRERRVTEVDLTRLWCMDALTQADFPFLMRRLTPHAGAA